MGLFWRKTNRGLWFGLALILLLIVFLVAGEISFALAQGGVKKTAKELTAALLEVNDVSEEGDTDLYLTDKQKQEQRAKLDAVIQEYGYTGKTKPGADYTALSGLHSVLSFWQEETNVKIEDLTYDTEQWEVSVSRDGPFRLIVTVKTDGIIAKEMGVEAKKADEVYSNSCLFPRSPENSFYAELSGQTELSFEMICQGFNWKTWSFEWKVIGIQTAANYGLLDLLF